MHRFALVLLLFAAPAPLLADAPSGVWSYPPELSGASVETYKTVGDVKLNAYIFYPSGEPTAGRTAVVFFFGGGWRAGTPGQFYPQCQYLAKRGAVAITVDYRVKNRHQASPQQCLADAKSAIRWTRANARRLGVDPNRIVAAGGSAGGHLAAATALIEAFEPDEDLTVSSSPNALVLFNPAVMLAPFQGENLLGPKKAADIRERMGGDPVSLSPIHHVRPALPPMLILHGTADEAVPFASVQRFVEEMKDQGNTCELGAFADQPHGFFNVGRGGSAEKQRQEKINFHQTLQKMDDFLVSRQLLQPSEG